MKKMNLFALFFSLVLLFCSVPVRATTEDTTDNKEVEWQTCTSYLGSNENEQDYLIYGKRIKSYLVPCTSGDFMRVQSDAGVDGILVEYYNKDFQLKDTKIIPNELPKFGGFYETDTNYYLLTGQENPKESADVEIFRMTKYDKNWNRISSAGLSDCFTTVPLNCGSAKMEEFGKYILIHTSIRMYKTSDGLCHQSNITMELDTESMKLVEINAYDLIYTSHSFNQLIKKDGNRAIIVDHGDGTARSFILRRFNMNLSTGRLNNIFDSRIYEKEYFSFPGEKGENKTGASVGGLEVSSSHYLIAGNSVIQDENNLNRTTRNIFIGVMDKELTDVKINWLTDYGEGDGTTSTPHMIKLSDTEFLVLWSRGDTVYYTKVDNKGEKKGQTYQFKGTLSDCVPTMINGKLTWYSWKDTDITFYMINPNDISKTTQKTIRHGHEMLMDQIAVKGYTTLKCKHCTESKSIRVANKINFYWRKPEEEIVDKYDAYYWNTYKEHLPVGYEQYYFGEVDPYEADRNIDVIVENEDVISYRAINHFEGVFTTLKPGKTKITFRLKYNPTVTRTVTLYVDGKLQIDSFTASPENTIRKGKICTLKAEAIGGDWNFSYKFSVEDKNGKRTVIKNYSKNASCSWVPDTEGKVTLYVDVKDGKGNVVTKKLDYEVTGNNFQEKDFTFTPPTNTMYDSFKKTAVVTGKSGIGKITVKYYDENGKAVEPVKAGIYTVKVDIADSTEYGLEKNLTFPSWRFEIQKAACAPNVPESTLQTSHGYGTVGNIKGLPKDWTWAEKDTILPVNGTVTATAEYCGSDAGSYVKETQEIIISTDGHSGGEAFCKRGAICEACGKEYGEVNPGHHDFQKATCIRKITCSVCGEQKGEIDPSNHVSKVVKNKKAASYLTTGYTGDTVCNDCHFVFSKGKQISKLVLGKPGSFRGTASKKAMTLKFTRVKDAAGTQVQYSKYASMKGSKIKSTTGGSIKVSKLTSKKSYYVRCRAYKKIGNKTVYSGWSTIKKIKIK